MKLTKAQIRSAIPNQYVNILDLDSGNPEDELIKLALSYKIAFQTQQLIAKNFPVLKSYIDKKSETISKQTIKKLVKNLEAASESKFCKNLEFNAQLFQEAMFQFLCDILDENSAYLFVFTPYNTQQLLEMDNLQLAADEICNCTSQLFQYKVKLRSVLFLFLTSQNPNYQGELKSQLKEWRLYAVSEAQFQRDLAQKSYFENRLEPADYEVKPPDQSQRSQIQSQSRRSQSGRFDGFAEQEDVGKQQLQQLQEQEEFLKLQKQSQQLQQSLKKQIQQRKMEPKIQKEEDYQDFQENYQERSIIPKKPLPLNNFDDDAPSPIAFEDVTYLKMRSLLEQETEDTQKMKQTLQKMLKKRQQEEQVKQDRKLVKQILNQTQIDAKVMRIRIEDVLHHIVDVRVALRVISENLAMQIQKVQRAKLQRLYRDLMALKKELAQRYKMVVQKLE